MCGKFSCFRDFDLKRQAKLCRFYNLSTEFYFDALVMLPEFFSEKIVSALIFGVFFAPDFRKVIGFELISFEPNVQPVR